MSPVLCGILSGIFICGAAIYGAFAGFWRSDAAGFQRVRYRELRSLMDVAPEKWRMDSFSSDYIVYKPTDEKIYMKSYFDTLRLIRMIKKIRKHQERREYTAQRAVLLKHFQSDIDSYKQKLNETLKEMDKDAGSMACRYCSDKWGCENDVSLPARKCPYRKYKTSKCTNGKSMMLWDRIKITFY